MATKRQKDEGLLRLQQLTETFNLNPKLCEYLSEGRIYYSYLVAEDLFGCIDTIEWDARFPKLVESFEKKNDAYVYHVIESKTRFGHMLCFLYVSKEKTEKTGRLSGFLRITFSAIHITLPPVMKSMGIFF